MNKQFLQIQSFCVRRVLRPASHPVPISLLAISVIFASGLLNVSSESEAKPTTIGRNLHIRPHTSVDIGDLVPERPNRVQFTLQNSGDNDILLTRIASDCGCAVVGIQTPVVLSPGKSLPLPFDWTAANVPGVQMRTAILYFIDNNVRDSVVFTFSGTLPGDTTSVVDVDDSSS